MRVICAPDKFKESLTALEAAQAMAQGIRSVFPAAEIDLCPIADGGEGTVDALLAATDGSRQTTTVQNPLGAPVSAAWGLIPAKSRDAGPRAVMEMAAASGLSLVPPSQRDPTRTSTFGTGQLIRAALDAGSTEILIGIGGSATNDSGTGMAQALGVRFFDHQEKLIEQPLTGGLLRSISRIDTRTLDPRLHRNRITVACDVTNPLTGATGAAHVYGPQKGATPAQVAELDAGLRHLAHLLRTQLHRDIENTPGAGAAGGLGGGLVAFLNATLAPGIDLVLQACDFSRRVTGATLCLTGEGRLDGQSLSGKAILGVAQSAQKHHVPTIALVGSVGPEADRVLKLGLEAFHVIAPDLPAAESMKRARELLAKKAAEIVRERLR